LDKGLLQAISRTTCDLELSVSQRFGPPSFSDFR
jgi:hypothetical protein